MSETIIASNVGSILGELSILYLEILEGITSFE